MPWIILLYTMFFWHITPSTVIHTLVLEGPKKRKGEPYLGVPRVGGWAQGLTWSDMPVLGPWAGSALVCWVWAQATSYKVLIWCALERKGSPWVQQCGGCGGWTSGSIWLQWFPEPWQFVAGVWLLCSSLFSPFLNIWICGKSFILHIICTPIFPNWFWG